MKESIAVSELKTHALRIVEEVARTGKEITITKRGRPVARLGPVDEPPSLAGSVRFLVPDEEFISPPPDEWDAER